MSKNLFLYFDVREIEGDLSYVSTVIDKDADCDSLHSCVYLESISVDELTPDNYFRRNYFGLRCLFGCDMEVSFSSEFLRIMAEMYLNKSYTD